jgi:hypothetical protein
LVAAIILHVFASSNVTSLGNGTLSGLRLGLFLVTPWTMTSNLFTQKPNRLTLIDGAYATVGCTLMGGILVFFRS